MPRPRMTQSEYFAYKAWKEQTSDGVSQRRYMILPDLHAPFIRKDAFDYAKRLAEKYDITDFACTGDVIDHHRSSFHTSESDAMSAEEEMEAAIKQLKPWHDEFPYMKISSGNHDRMLSRKIKEAGVPERSLKSLAEIYEVPTWDFKGRQDLGHNTVMIHGIGRMAHRMADEEGKNIIMGHKHTKTEVRQMYIKLYGQVWSMQIGALMDDESYAARYADGGASSIPSIGFLFENDDQWIPFFKILGD